MLAPPGTIGVLRRKRQHETVVRLRQIHAQEMPLLLDPANHHYSLAKVHLGIPWRMHQRHEQLLLPQARFPHVTLHHGVAAAEAVLYLEPIPKCLAVCCCFFGCHLSSSRI